MLMNSDRKDNFYQGYKGVGRHDEGGSFGNYSNYQDKQGRNWRKIIIIGGVLIAVISVIGLIAQNSGGTTLPPSQLNIENIAKDQSLITDFVNKYESDLDDRDAQILSAHISAINSTNYIKITNYYSENFTSRARLEIEVGQDLEDTMSEATDRGNFDEVYSEEILKLVNENKADMQSLFATTTRENLKAILEESYDGYELVDSLAEEVN